MRTNLHLVTLALDAMPFLPMQLAMLNRVDTKLVNWHLTVVEGAAANTNSTAWCQPQTARLSTDGTTELLDTWKSHPRISVYRKPFWPGGKDEMFNQALRNITRPGVLLQVDCDELWLPNQLESLLDFFAAYGQIKCAMFFSRYFLGPNIISTTRNSYGNNSYEWVRSWRFTPGLTLKSHEPPVIIGATEPCATREQTEEVGLVFDHWSWVFEKQVAYKEKFYGYTDAVRHWRRLQANTVWPVKLKEFLPWVDERATADQLFKP